MEHEAEASGSPHGTAAATRPNWQPSGKLLGTMKISFANLKPVAYAAPPQGGAVKPTTITKPGNTYVPPPKPNFPIITTQQPNPEENEGEVDVEPVFQPGTDKIIGYTIIYSNGTFFSSLETNEQGDVTYSGGIKTGK